MNTKTFTFCIVCALVLVVSTNTTRADYFKDRQAAAALAEEGKHAEALNAFLAIADSKLSDVQTSDALAQAVACAIALNDHVRATKLAKQIPLAARSKLAQMRVLHVHGNRNAAELIKQFGDEDLSQWPEHIAAKAWLIRGEAAASVVEHYKLAATDLDMAVRFPMNTRTRAETLNLLASVYTRLGQEDEAIAVYKRVSTMADHYRASDAARSLAGIYTARGEHDNAIQILEAINLDLLVMDPYHHSWAIGAMGDALAASGDVAGAIARYQQVIAIKGAPDHFKATCKKKIATLRLVGE